MRSRIFVGLAILGSVTGMAALTILAGDEPMRTNSVPGTAHEGVGMLLWDTLDAPQRGKQLILQERKELISQLSVVITDPQNHGLRNRGIKAAMSLLGELRAPEGVEVLVAHIGFPFVEHPETGEPSTGAVEGGMFAMTVEELYPAVPALIKIGEPCVEDVIDKLATTDDPRERKACETVLRKLSQGASVRERLERAIKEAKAREPEALRHALKMLDVPLTPKANLRQRMERMKEREEGNARKLEP